jgi:hypothetical protein
MGIVLLSLLGVQIRAYLTRRIFHLWQAVTILTVDSMTTRGASGLAVHQNWQVMGALEAVAGI